MLLVWKEVRELVQLVSGRQPNCCDVQWSRGNDRLLVTGKPWWVPQSVVGVVQRASRDPRRYLRSLKASEKKTLLTPDPVYLFNSIPQFYISFSKSSKDAT